MEENADHQQHEATDLTSSKHRNASITTMETPHTQRYSNSKVPSVSVTSSHPEPQKQPTLNIRSDLKRQNSTTDLTNMMSSTNKGLGNYGGDITNNHQVF